MYIRIYKEKKSATQSSAPGNKWILEVIPALEESFTDETMQWNATGDSQKQVKLKFNDYDSAVKYAKSKGMKIIDSTIEGPNNVKRIKKNYLNNF